MSSIPLVAWQCVRFLMAKIEAISFPDCHKASISLGLPKAQHARSSSGKTGHLLICYTGVIALLEDWEKIYKMIINLE